MRISVLGAYGYTGKLICGLLEEERIPFTVAGRNENLLREFVSAFDHCSGFIKADVRSAEGIENLLSASDILINCAGPFTEESAELVRVLSHSGKTYLDITGEIGFVRDSRIQNHDAALASGALLVHACAFESLVADFGMRILASQLQTIREVQTFYQLAHARPSPGTKLTMKLARFREPWKISGGAWALSDLQNDRLKCNWPEKPELTVAVPYPLPEIAFSEWKLRPAESGSFLLLDTGAALFVNANTNQNAEKDSIIRAHREKKSSGPDEASRKKQECNLFVFAKDISGKEKIIRLSGSDMYLVTAKAILRTLSVILKQEKKYSGVISPADLFEGKEKEILEGFGFQIDETSIFSFVPVSE